MRSAKVRYVERRGYLTLVLEGAGLGRTYFRRSLIFSDSTEAYNFQVWDLGIDQIVFPKKQIPNPGLKTWESGATWSGAVLWRRRTSLGRSVPRENLVLLSGYVVSQSTKYYPLGTSWYLVFVRLPSGYLELNRGSLSICLLTLYCTRSFNFNWFHTASHVCSQMKSTDEFWRYREAVTGYTRWANTSRTISKAIQFDLIARWANIFGNNLSGRWQLRTMLLNMKFWSQRLLIHILQPQ